MGFVGYLFHLPLCGASHLVKDPKAAFCLLWGVKSQSRIRGLGKGMNHDVLGFRVRTSHVSFFVHGRANWYDDKREV